MKINEVIAESVYDFFTKAGARSLQRDQQRATRAGVGTVPAGAQPAPQTTAPAGAPKQASAATTQLPTTSYGVQVLSAARPIILRWKKQDYALTDNDTWVFLGSNKPASPEMSTFLTKNLEEL